jgi:hypothetical protein
LSQDTNTLARKLSLIDKKRHISIAIYFVFGIIAPMDAKQAIIQIALETRRKLGLHYSINDMQVWAQGYTGALALDPICEYLKPRLLEHESIHHHIELLNG